MLVHDFYNFYNLKEMSIDSITLIDDKLYMLITMDVDLELIANGYRPSMDLEMHHMAIFNNAKASFNLSSLKVIKDYTFSDNKIIISNNDSKIEIEATSVDILPNYKKK